MQFQTETIFIATCMCDLNISYIYTPSSSLASKIFYYIAVLVVSASLCPVSFTSVFFSFLFFIIRQCVCVCGLSVHIHTQELLLFTGSCIPSSSAPYFAPGGYGKSSYNGGNGLKYCVQFLDSKSITRIWHGHIGTDKETQSIRLSS